MKRYFSLLWNIIKNNLILLMEFRANFFIGLFIDLMWVSLQLIVINIFFQFTDTIVGWSKSDFLVFMGVFRIIKGLFDVFFRPNIHAIPYAVNQGEMDYILTKPVNSLFLSSVRIHQYSESMTIAMGIGILIYGFSIADTPFNPVSLLYLVALVPLGLVIFYCFLLSFAALSIFFQRLRATYNYYDIISNTFRYPLDVLGYNHRFASTLLIPFLVVFTTPAKLVLGKLPPIYLLVEAISSALIFSATYAFWKFALRHYSSASS